MSEQILSDLTPLGEAVLLPREGTPTLMRLAEPHICLDKVAAPTGDLPPREVPQDWLPPKINEDGTIDSTGTISQPLVGVTELMWNTGQTLRVRMTGGTALVRSKVRQFAEEWTKYANIRFEFVDDSQPAEIKISFDPGGSWSLVGRTALWVPFNFSTMNFGWLNDETSDQEFSRVVLHEFGHALGLVHEHQSPIGGIQWDREKVYAYFEAAQGWDRSEVNEQVFKKYEVDSTNYSRYDPASIMHYSIPAELTLNGQGVPFNTALSAIDKEYVGRWYPYPPSPANAQGLLRTGDDCDEIDFSVEYNVVSADTVEFGLFPAPGIDWWKAIDVPVGSADYVRLEMKDGSSAQAPILKADLDSSRPLRFGKAKFLGRKTLLEYTWDVISALPGGTRLNLTWKRDKC